MFAMLRYDFTHNKQLAHVRSGMTLPFQLLRMTIAMGMLAKLLPAWLRCLQRSI